MYLGERDGVRLEGARAAAGALDPGGARSIYIADDMEVA
jgi:hypothetical protein